MPTHEVPAYAHQPNSHFPHGWCTIMCPPYTFPLTFCHFPTPRCCHTCSKSSHIAAFGHSHPPCHPQPGVTPLQHWPQRPFFWEAGTLIGGPPPLSSYLWQCFTHTHMHISISGQITTFGPACPSLPFQCPGQFGPPPALKSPPSS